MDGMGIVGRDTTSAKGPGPDETRCPVCNEGDLVEIAYHLAGEFEPSQQPDSLEVQVFSCGHRVSGATLSSADPAQLNVEQRTSEETVDPLPDDPGADTAPSD